MISYLVSRISNLVSSILRALEFDPVSGLPVASRKAGLDPYLYYAKHVGPAPGWMLPEVGSFGPWSNSRLRSAGYVRPPTGIALADLLTFTTVDDRFKPSQTSAHACQTP